MNQILETVPATWSDADERFFAVVKRVLSAEYLLGATVLLASYDDDIAAPSRSTAPATSVACTPRQGVQALPR